MWSLRRILKNTFGKLNSSRTLLDLDNLLKKVTELTDSASKQQRNRICIHRPDHGGAWKALNQFLSWACKQILEAMK